MASKNVNFSAQNSCRWRESSGGHRGFGCPAIGHWVILTGVPYNDLGGDPTKDVNLPIETGKAEGVGCDWQWRFVLPSVGYRIVHFHRRLICVINSVSPDHVDFVLERKRGVPTPRGRHVLLL